MSDLPIREHAQLFEELHCPLANLGPVGPRMGRAPRGVNWDTQHRDPRVGTKGKDRNRAEWMAVRDAMREEAWAPLLLHPRAPQLAFCKVDFQAHLAQRWNQGLQVRNDTVQCADDGTVVQVPRSPCDVTLKLDAFVKRHIQAESKA